MDFISQSATVQCQSCSDKHGSPPYIEISVEPATSTFVPQPHPTNCPRCGKLRSSRPHDWADILCQTYFGLTRKAALAILATYNQSCQSGSIDNTRSVYTYMTQYTAKGCIAGQSVEVNERRQSLPSSLAAFKQSRDILDYLTGQGFAVTLQRGYTAPLDATCRDCGGQFTYIRGIVDVQRGTDGGGSTATKLHCVWCGSSSLITGPENTDETAYTVLSINYSLPIHIIKLFYDSYCKSTRYQSFASYMESPDVQQILTLLAATADESAPVV